jgi:prepilin-type N-terminal cleavage/methylation domain-containing protein
MPSDINWNIHETESRGFTLIEVLVALTLGALVILLAHRTFTGVTEGVVRLTQERLKLDREVNARRWVTAALGSLDISNASGGFAGRPEAVEFGTWLLTPRAWYARRRVTIAKHNARLVASIAGDSVVLADEVSELQVDYLLDLPGETRGDSTPGALSERVQFVRQWVSPVSAPVAIRFRIGRVPQKGGAVRVDTLLIIVGPRG